MASQPTALTRLPRKAASVTVLAIALLPHAAEPAAAAPVWCGTGASGRGVASKHSMEAETLARLNVIRRDHGLSSLRANKKLRTAAMAHARDMMARHYFAHNAPGGPRWSYAIKQSGYLSGHRGWSIGQNIAWGRYECRRPRGIVYMWMHSPRHRRVILTARFRDVGIAIVDGAPLPVDGPAATYVADFGVRR